MARGPGLVAAARDRGGETALLASLVVGVAVLAVLPMARLLLEGVAPGGRFDLSVLGEALESPSTWRAARHSLEVGFGGTAVALVVGSAFALLVALTDLRRKAVLAFAFLVPMMIPPQITALSWIQLFGPSSPLLHTLGLAPPVGTPNPIYSRQGIVLLLGIQYAPLVFLTVRAGLRGLPRELVEAARAAGAGPWRVVATVVLPLMTPPLAAAAALAFVSCIGNFGIPALLGIPARYTVLPTLIYQRLAGFGPSIISEVAVLSILVAVIAFAGIGAQAWALGRRDVRTTGPARTPLEYHLGRWRPWAEAACWLAIAAVVVVPLIALTATSLVRAYGVPVNAATATLFNYGEVMFRQAVTQRAFVNSFVLAGGAALLLAVVAVPLAYFVAWRRNSLVRALDFAVEVPYALPGVVLAIACILVFLKPLPVVAVSLYGTGWIIFFAYLARFLTLALRPTVAGFHQLDRRLEEAAQAAGAGLAYRLRTVILPLVLPVAVAGGILVFMLAVSELTVSVLLWSAGTETLGVVVYNLEDGGHTVLACAVSVLSVLLILALMLGVQALAPRLPPGVVPWRT